MFRIFFSYFTIDKDIVEIDDIKDIEIFSKYVINKYLEGYRGVSEFERYNIIFEVSISGLERGFLFFAFLNTYKVIYSSKIELSEVLGSDNAVY